jgi:hypothetical protein
MHESLGIGIGIGIDIDENEFGNAPHRSERTINCTKRPNQKKNNPWICYSFRITMRLIHL